MSSPACAISFAVPDSGDAEDILQDVFYKFVEANSLLMPIERVTAWLFRVARNCITDLFRKQKPERLSDLAVRDEHELLPLEDLLPSPDAGPEALYARNLLLEEIEELPEEKRDVFLAHELEGRSFKEMASETGVNVSTLLSRKRYAVQHTSIALVAADYKVIVSIRGQWRWCGDGGRWWQMVADGGRW